VSRRTGPKTDTRDKIAKDNAPTFNSLYDYLGDGIVVSQSMARSLLIAIDISKISDQARQKINGSTSGGYAGFIEGSVSALMDSFAASKHDTVTISCFPDEVGCPPSLAIAASGSGKILADIPKLYAESMQQFNKPAGGSAMVSAVTLLPIHYVANFPLAPQVATNYSRTTDLLRLYREKLLQFNQLNHLKVQAADAMRVEITSQGFDKLLNAPNEQLQKVSDAVGALKKVQLSDSNAFNAAYDLVNNQLNQFSAMLDGLLDKPINVRLGGRLTMAGSTKRGWGKDHTGATAAFTFELVPSTVTVGLISNVDGAIQVKGSCVYTPNKLEINFPISTIKFAELLKPLSTLTVKDFSPLDAEQAVSQPINFNGGQPDTPIPLEELAGSGRSSTLNPPAPKITLTYVAQNEGNTTWLYLNPSITADLSFKATTRLRAIYNLCWPHGG
jgi:hypothetical protein